jgi:hypothetical protein
MSLADEQFFAEGYLEMYSDIAKSKMNPKLHYTSYGKKEGRDNGTHPSAEQFFREGYLEMYPDVAESKNDPWRHYVLSGKKEGRDNGTHPGTEQFFREGYLEMYPDVAKSKMDPWRHYVLSGKKEGRDNGTHPSAEQFFREGYLEMYPDVAKSKMDPWRHYVLSGKKDGRDNGTHPDTEQFFREGYLEMYPDVVKLKIDPWHHYVLFGKKEGRSNSIYLKKKTASIEKYSSWLFDLHENKSNFIDDDGRAFCRKANDPKIFAYYLPQFHAIPINDRSFGKGFTEWTNVSRASPLFLGHVQPRVPYDVGFYNLENVDVLERQVELAKQFGIYGFCFYYYWFSGKKVLEKPLKLFLDSKIDFKFHLMWANENWAKLWDGGNKEVILKQEFDFSDIDNFYKDILPYIMDKRYEKVNNKPILAVYRPALFEEKLFKDFVLRLNELAVKDGFNGFYFLGTNSFNFSEPEKYDLEGVIEFPPHSLHGIKTISQNALEWFNLKCNVTIYDLHKWLKAKYHLRKERFNVFKCCFPHWDNSPRKAYKNATIFLMKDGDFFNWLSDIVRWTKENHTDSEQYVYINAWNEWGEGAFLEPDLRFGYKSLLDVRRVLEERS